MHHPSRIAPTRVVPFISKSISLPIILSNPPQYAFLDFHYVDLNRCMSGHIHYKDLSPWI